ncbi:MAG: hypothetical protein HUU32_12770 [Calditrichaceae bacterium]|nr:hypothetical protein [Calditrichia bacterium]NUQ42263.1 hypothetical protein [Calditrichaceae bacterium]
MAIDSERKRKSVAAISHYAMGPVVVPDGTLISADRQVIGFGYYGVKAETKIIVTLLGAIYCTIILAGETCGVLGLSGKIQGTVELTGEVNSTRGIGGKVQERVVKSGEV